MIHDAFWRRLLQTHIVFAHGWILNDYGMVYEHGLKMALEMNIDLCGFLYKNGLYMRMVNGHD